MSLGERLLQLRKDQGLSAKKFGEMLGNIHETSIYNYESNRHIPGIGVIEKICKIFGANGHWLITGEGNMYIYSTGPSTGKLNEPSKFAITEEQYKDLIKKQSELEGRLKQLEKKP